MKILAALFLVFLVMTATVVVSGCTQQSIQTEDQALDTLKDVSGDISDLEDTLAEIDNTLG